MPDGGTVQFLVDGINVATAVIVNPDGTATSTVNSLAAGNHTVTATFSGTSNYAFSTASLTHTVTPAATSTAIAASVSPSIYGQPVTFIATVSPVPDGGTVQFLVDGINVGSAVGVGPDGTAEAPEPMTLPAGSHTVTALFSGTANFAGSQGTMAQDIAEADTAVTLTADVDGETATLTATVEIVPPGTGTPTGTIEFRDGDRPLGEALLAGGVATYEASLAPGDHALTAIYSSDDNRAAATSPVVSVTVAQPATTTTTTTTTTTSTTTTIQPSLPALPRTGSASGTAATVGTVLIAAGTALAALARRRRQGTG